jgi:hypothetical protein
MDAITEAYMEMCGNPKITTKLQSKPNQIIKESFNSKDENPEIKEVVYEALVAGRHDGEYKVYLDENENICLRFGSKRVTVKLIQQ